MSGASDMALFASTAAFRRGFEQGLERLLQADALNLFILVAANAEFHAALFGSLRERLQQHCQAHAERLREAFVRGGRLAEADDDLLVFLKIVSIGFDALALTEQRRAGVWEVQFNHLRSFRPLRSAQRPMSTIRAPFDAQDFNFNKPFMQREALWSGEWQGRRVDLYYNKYPFVDLHCLLVPQREDALAQFHRQEMHAFIWQQVQQLAATMPGIRVGYNALGAYASVNHLHYHLFVREAPLAVELGGWQHNGGAEAYPVDCHCFDSIDTAWQFIEHLQAADEAYNLLYTPGRLYCMPRRKQGAFSLAPWSSGLSWYEMAGGIITFNRQDYTVLTEACISTALTAARLPGAPIP